MRLGLPSDSSSSVTCSASSRVGTRTSAAGAACVRVDALDDAAMAKASVLPEPVGDLASTSRPASAAGMTRAWIWKGLTMSRAASALTTSALAPSAAKDAPAFGFSTPVRVGRDLTCPRTLPCGSRKKTRSHGATRCHPSVQGSRSHVRRGARACPGPRVRSRHGSDLVRPRRPVARVPRPGLIADCARAALERDGTTILSYGVGGGYGPLRESLAERHGVEPGRVFVTVGGLQGFVVLRRRPARAPARPRARRGADVRPAAEAPRLARAPRSCALPMDGEGLDLDALETELDRGGDVSFLYTIPTFQNPSGRTLGRRAAPAARRDRRRARPRRARGRPVRAGALRRRAPAVAARARGWRAA